MNPTSPSRRHWLKKVTALATATAGASQFATLIRAATATISPPARPRARRVLYNFDGDSCLSTRAGG